MLLYVVCNAGEFIWNAGGVVQLPAPYITLCDFYLRSANFSVSIQVVGQKCISWQNIISITSSPISNVQNQTFQICASLVAVQGPVYEKARAQL